jgi:anhydro-N-acetylmuramic acid kinase
MGERYVGLISGTSADAIDAALIEVGGDGRPSVLATRATPWDDRLRERILHFARREAPVDVDDLATLDAEVGDAFAEAALALLASANVDPRSIRAIGSHGQTLRHRVDHEIPFTLQVGDPTRIAERTGITTVATSAVGMSQPAARAPRSCRSCTRRLSPARASRARC